MNCPKVFLLNRIEIGEQSLLQGFPFQKDFYPFLKELMLNLQNEHPSLLLSFFPYLYPTNTSSI